MPRINRLPCVQRTRTIARGACVGACGQDTPAACAASPVTSDAAPRGGTIPKGGAKIWKNHAGKRAAAKFLHG
jgi:hypothetical protein